MSRPPCPIPQVEDALSPYIHTRQETIRIRQSLTEYLKKHLQDEQPLSHLSLTCPPPSLKATTTSIPSDGLYKQYLEALTAHQRVQDRYAAIKDEIHELHSELRVEKGMALIILAKPIRDSWRFCRQNFLDLITIDLENDMTC
jgi:hypothetical protein